MIEISSYELYRSVEGQLQANAPAPNFTLLDSDAKPFKLSDHRGKNIAIAFYPADWSPVCKNEFALFQEALEEIQGYNAEIVGISVDSHYSHHAWADHLHVTIPLLSDFWPHGAVVSATVYSRTVMESPGGPCSFSMRRVSCVRCGSLRINLLRPA